MHIPEIDYHLDKLDCDRLTFNYLEYPEQFIELDKFKENIDEYDYIVIATNDVIVKQENIDQLRKDIRGECNPPVICGCFNLDINHNFDKLNICERLPKNDIYDWYKKSDVNGMIEVEFAGFPLMAIRSDIFKRYVWTGALLANDVRFCKWCKDNEIIIKCNTDNRMLHLRHYGEPPINKTHSVEWLRKI